MYFRSPFALTAVSYFSQIDLLPHWRVTWVNAAGVEEEFCGSTLTPALCYSEMTKKIRELATLSHPKIRPLPTDQLS